MWLDCGEHGPVPLCRVTPYLVESPDPRDVPPCIATLVVVVDEQIVRWPVILVDGFSTVERFAVAVSIDEDVELFKINQNQQFFDFLDAIG